jgi:hypothetical protein
MNLLRHDEASGPTIHGLAHRVSRVMAPVLRKTDYAVV